MELYYINQASSVPYFSGHYRQRGSSFGALASGRGRIALPLARKFNLPAAERVGKELLLQSVPELVDVVSKKKIRKAGVEKHYFEYSEKANRRLISTATETTKLNESETV